MLSFFRVLIILLKGIIPRFASVIHGLACFRGFVSLVFGRFGRFARFARFGGFARFGRFVSVVSFRCFGF